jgi:hypothetical protein
MRPIDADALKLMNVTECDGHTIDFARGWKSCIEYCKNDAPTIEVVTKERFHEVALEVLHSIANEAEFMGQYDNADRALRVFVNAIVLGTLEHRLFGGKENATD